jgi:hypothetical protein
MRPPATGLWDELVSFPNLYRAWLRARAGKRARRDVARFEFRAEDELIRMQRELRDGTYRFGGYRSFRVRDGGKERLISAAPFRDRVVHHALTNLLEPLCERHFIRDSYASRLGKGTHAALDRARRWAREYRFCLKGDVERYFPSIDHAILKGLVRRWIADERFLALLDEVIDGGAGVLASEYRPHWFAGDDLLGPCRPRGLPVGNQTSQLLSNVYLHPLDLFVKQELRARAYVRYVDDFLVFGHSYRWLEEVRERIIERLADLRLVLHARKRQVLAVRNGVPFVGFVVGPRTVRLARGNVARAKRRFRAQRAACAAGRLPAAKATESIRSWCAHAAHGDTWRLRAALLADATLPGGLPPPPPPAPAEEPRP